MFVLVDFGFCFELLGIRIDFEIWLEFVGLILVLKIELFCKICLVLYFMILLLLVYKFCVFFLFIRCLLVLFGKI